MAWKSATVRLFLVSEAKRPRGRSTTVCLLAPRMQWPLGCFVARAPRNDGRGVASPIDSIVLRRRLVPSCRLRLAERQHQPVRPGEHCDRVGEVGDVGIGEVGAPQGLDFDGASLRRR
jgi:hypothetical protein